MHWGGPPVALLRWTGSASDGWIVPRRASQGKLLLFKRNDDLIVRQLNACNRKLITGTLRIRRCLQEREANGGHMPQHLSSHFVYLQSMYISILGEKYQLIAQREKNLIALAFLDTAQFQVNLV